MVGVGYRREMSDWDMSVLDADFFEVAPENWLRRDRDPLHALKAQGKSIYLHGVSLNLGGTSPINKAFLIQVRQLKQELGAPFYSDHLAASGDAHQLYDLFPIPLTQKELIRVSDRISAVQDILGESIAIENSTWYTNTGECSELDFVNGVLHRADCRLLLDLNNVSVNYKNHAQTDLSRFIHEIDLSRVAYLHVAGHEFDSRFGMYIDTHSQPVEDDVKRHAADLSRLWNLDILLEWDNDIPAFEVLNEELKCIKRFTTMSVEEQT